MSSVFVARFAQVARARGEDVLLWAPHEGRRLRGSDILDEADAVSRVLDRAGVPAGALILSTVGNQSTFVALLLACLRGSWPLLALDRGTPAAEVQMQADRWGASVLVAPQQGSAPSAHATTHALPGGLWATVLEGDRDLTRYAGAAVLKTTSGSTGLPKVTRTAERHLVADVTQIAEGMDIGPETRQLGVIPLSHSYGLSNLVLPLLWHGSPLLLHPGFVPAQIASDADAFGAETWAGVPFMFEHVARLDATPFPPRIRTVISAGARLPFEVVEAFHRRTGRKVHSFYGSSETGGICYDASDTLWSDVPVGHPLGATVVTLREDADAPAGSGRVVVHGPGVVDGYADGADPDAFDAGGFVTSDFGHVRADGQLVLTGRASSVVNIAGRKVLPGEVESAMRLLPGVRDVVVVGVEDARRGQSLGACFVADRPMRTTDVRAALVAQLSAYKVPRALLQLDALPLTPRGKVDRDAVRARLTGLLAGR